MKKIALVSALTLCAGLLMSTASFAATKTYTAPELHGQYQNNQMVGSWSFWKDPQASSNINLSNWPGQTVRHHGHNQFALVTHAGGISGPWYGLFRIVKAKSCHAIGDGSFSCSQ